MAINFSNNTSLSEVSGLITAPSHIVQTVHTATTANTSTTSTSPVDVFTSNPITLSSASNKVIIEVNTGISAGDWGDGVWNLMFIDIVHVNSGTQLTYSGYNGEQTNNRRHIHRMVTHAPGSIGPHTYKLRFWCYQASTGYINGGNMDNTVIYIRLTEIAA